EIALARQALRNDMRVMLPDDLTNRAEFLGFAEIRTESPNDFAVSSDNCEKTCLAAADDDVVGSEPLISFVEPVVRTDIRCRVDMQPIKAAARRIRTRRSFYCVSRGSSETEFFDVVACKPLPYNLAIR